MHKLHFKNYVKNEEIKEIDIQTDDIDINGRRFGLGINMYNKKWEKKLEYMEINQLIGGLILSICECNVQKDKLKEHIIRLLGGSTRKNIDDLQSEFE